MRRSEDDVMIDDGWWSFHFTLLTSLFFSLFSEDYEDTQKRERRIYPERALITRIIHNRMAKCKVYTHMKSR